mmetsp:Transcript_894/g.1799  ORF Transcript_894/g.1799 Transcript_894/m.1799 type:complete len:154 (+) Transcript_894:1444-1905(+)
MGTVEAALQNLCGGGQLLSLSLSLTSTLRLLLLFGGGGGYRGAAAAAAAGGYQLKRRFHFVSGRRVGGGATTRGDLCAHHFSSSSLSIVANGKAGLLSSGLNRCRPSEQQDTNDRHDDDAASLRMRYDDDYRHSDSPACLLACLFGSSSSSSY